MGVRFLDRMSRVKPSISFHSHKMQRTMYAESRNELAYLYKLEFDETVLCYITQPQTFQYEFEGKKRVYTPDYLINYIDGTYRFIDTKVDADKSNPILLKKFYILERHFKYKLKVPLSLAFNGDFNKGFSVRNLKFLYGYLMLAKPDTEFKILSEKICVKAIKYGDLISICKDLGFDECIPASLIAHSYYKFNIEKEFISHDTEVVRI